MSYALSKSSARPFDMSLVSDGTGYPEEVEGVLRSFGSPVALILPTPTPRVPLRVGPERVPWTGVTDQNMLADPNMASDGILGKAQTRFPTRS